MVILHGHALCRVPLVGGWVGGGGLGGGRDMCWGRGGLGDTDVGWGIGKGGVGVSFRDNVGGIEAAQVSEERVEVKVRLGLSWRWDGRL